jgi:wobble nucleotide-excising tRNase
MKITKIYRIKGHRIFQEFSWPADLPEFGRFNLLYGWNGCGKTTLSNLMRSIERKQNVVEGDCEFLVDRDSHRGNTFATGLGLPSIRVFNRDFVGANFSAAAPASVNPIYFIGEDSVEKQKQIGELKKKLEIETAEAARKSRQKKEAAHELDSLCVREAKAIKDLLSSSPPNRYNNYDKRDFRATIVKLRTLDVASKTLAAEKKAELRQQRNEKPKEKLKPLAVVLPKAHETERSGRALTNQIVVSQILKELTADNDVADWVQHGLVLHQGEHATNRCRFCENQISAERLAKLEAHFNDEYNRLLNQLDTAIENIESSRSDLRAIRMPDKAQVYDHLASDFEAACKDFEQFAKSLDAVLKHVVIALGKKRAKPFEALPSQFESSDSSMPMDSDGVKLLEKIDAFIRQHNAECDNFQASRDKACRELEEGLVADALDEFQEKESRVIAATREVEALSQNMKALQTEINQLEKEIVSHRQPAEELNKELRDYLGRDELRFEFKGSGYQITRNGLPASNLSEGERTAIAFLYFLKSLQDKNFDLKRDIVVIDDPVSSLDTNSLFCAFGYMRARTKNAGQLFILTHNFSFFRQARNWLHRGLRGADKKEARFYFIEAVTRNGKRNASIAQLDKLLREYESEYHYLFKRIYEEAQKAEGGQPLEEYYHLPNLGRRLLEAFFAFRFPQERGSFYNQLERSKCAPETRSRLLRFLDTYSHNQSIGESGEDLSILAETPQILKNLMDVIKEEDPAHYTEMEQLITTP